MWLRVLTVCAVLAVLPARAADIQRWRTASGAEVLLSERHELPMADVSVLFKGAGDAAGTEAAFAAAMVMRGTPDLDEEAFAARVNDLGANLSGSSDLEYTAFSLRSLSDADKFRPALKLFAAALGRPRFEAAVLKRLQDQAVLSLAQSESYPEFVGGRALERLNYPDHPYGRSARDTADSFRAVSVADVQNFHRRRYGRNNAVIVIVGDVNRSQAQNIVAEIEAVLPETARNETVPPVNVRGGQFRHIPFADRQQSHIHIGLPVLKADDPDYFPMLVGNYILGGGGFDSRLMKVLRDTHGYTYGASSSLAANVQAAPFTIAFATENRNAPAALAAARKVLAEFVEEGVREDELAQAKAYITGSFPLRFDTNAKMAANLAAVGVYGRPDDWFDRYAERVRAVSAADIKRAWQARVRPAEMNIVVTGGKPFTP